MNFRECLNSYIEILGCTAKELSEASSVSAAVISRYRSGEREPGAESAQLSAIAKGIAKLSHQRGMQPFSEEEVYLALLQSITGIRIDYNAFLSNLHALLEALAIGNNELARALQYDPSYISRLLSGKRHPSDLPELISMISAYVARRFQNRENDLYIIADLIDCNVEEAADPERCADLVAKWLGSSNMVRVNNVAKFLRTLDGYDAGTFREQYESGAEDAGELPDPECFRREYNGMEGMRQAELQFTTVMLGTKENEKVISYSDWPLESIREDEAFMKRWNRLNVSMLRKGHEIYVIHNVHRPFRQLMENLEKWIPMYMTGKVRPFYLKMPQGDPFLRAMRCSRSAVLMGNSILGHEEEGRFYFSRAEHDTEYYYASAVKLLKRARPLLDIYRDGRAEEYIAFYSRVIAMDGKRSIAMCTLPIFTISDELLRSMLERLHVPEEDHKRILIYVNHMRKLMKDTLDKSMFEINVPKPDQKAFQRGNYRLSLSGMFYERELPYTYEEYQEHLRLTEEYAQKMRGLILTGTASPEYRNINITFHEGKYVVISKNDQPIVHFTIEYPSMLQAFENFNMKF